jgi:hypothetical protein
MLYKLVFGGKGTRHDQHISAAINRG